MRAIVISISAVLVFSAPAFAVLQSSSNSDSSTLVSSDMDFNETNEAPAPRNSNIPVKLKLSLKSANNPPPSVAASATPEDPFALGTSKTVHPASAAPESTSPFVQTVNSPNTMPYGKPRRTAVLDPGKVSYSVSTKTSSQQNQS